MQTFGNMPDVMCQDFILYGIKHFHTNFDSTILRLLTPFPQKFVTHSLRLVDLQCLYEDNPQCVQELYAAVRHKLEQFVVVVSIVLGN